MRTSEPVQSLDSDGWTGSGPPEQSPARRTRFGRKKVAGAAAAVIVLAGGGTGAWYGLKGKSTTASATPALTTTSKNVTVTTGTMKETVSASGTLEPSEDSDLTFAVSGTVTAVDVKTGEKVTAGQTLATVDATALSDQLEADEATLTSDEDRLTTDKDDSASTSTIDSDEVQVTSAQSEVSTAETDVSDAALKATFAGTVAAVDLAVGDVVSSGGGAGSATSGAGDSTGSDSSSTDGITVISSDSYQVSTSVDDTEVGEVAVGDQAVITPSSSTTSVYGTVASVSLLASTSDSSDSDTVASFPVVIDVTGSPTGLYPGATVTVSMVVKQLNDVVEVPTAAISYTNGEPTVTKVVDGAQQTQVVGTGISLNGYTQITSGLTAGDVIVEKVVSFKTGSGTTRSILGGSTSGGSGGSSGFPTGGFGGGATGGSFGGSFGGGSR